MAWPLSFNPTVIIPAAGYGTRIGSPPAKEMLTRPGASEAFIDLPIRLSIQRGWRVVVVTRSDKSLLIEHIHHRYPQVELCLIGPTPDWQRSVLLSRGVWGERNLLWLPDVEFSPIAALDNVAAMLEDHDVAVAHHAVDTPRVWGHVWQELGNSTQGEHFYVIEKPSGELMAGMFAWGLIGFKRDFGEKLLKAQWLSQKEQRPQRVEGRLGSCRLTHFEDLTRGTLTL